MVLDIVATPIGNLGDISERAIKTLKEVDFILCEDTRVTKKLLDRFGIGTPMISYHQHSKMNRTGDIINLLREGKNLALVTDAGTPGISDPGGKLIQALYPYSGRSSGIRNEGIIEIVPIPGPCALTAAASVSGFPMDRFLFLGFPPTKNKRRKFFEEILNSKYPVIFYESSHRIIKTLRELGIMNKELGDKKLNAVVCRELTKIYETIYRGELNEALEKVEKDPVKGEFTVVIGRNK